MARDGGTILPIPPELPKKIPASLCLAQPTEGLKLRPVQAESSDHPAAFRTLTAILFLETS